MASDLQVVDKSLRSVFVGNIPYEATEEKLKEIFSQVGPVLSFKLVYDRETGKPKGYGFCEYRDQETALSAMRNLNGFEISGRTLRVDNACTEKSRLELQSLMSGPTNEGPYGTDIEPEKAPEAISKAVASLPPEQMFELMKQMKLCIQNNPSEARAMLLQNPQLAYALLQAQVVMRIVDPQTAMNMLHKVNKLQPPIMPVDNVNFHPAPQTIIKTEFNGSPAGRDFVTNRTENYPTVVPPVPLTQEFLPAAPISETFAPKREEDISMGAPKIGLLGDRPPGVLGRSQMVSSVVPFSGRQDLDLRQMDPRLQTGDLDLRLMSNKCSAPRLPSHESFDRDPRLRDPRVDTEFRESRDSRQGFERSYERDPRLGNIGNARTVPAPDQEKAALIMQVLQLSDDQIAMLPADQRQSIMVLKEQIARSAAQSR